MEDSIEIDDDSLEQILPFFIFIVLTISFTYFLGKVFKYGFLYNLLIGIGLSLLLIGYRYEIMSFFENLRNKILKNKWL